MSKIAIQLCVGTGIEQLERISCISKGNAVQHLENSSKKKRRADWLKAEIMSLNLLFEQ